MVMGSVQEVLMREAASKVLYGTVDWGYLSIYSSFEMNWGFGVYLKG
jgi:hypothetical protein